MTKWLAHCQSTLLKPVLLIDEAQHVSVECLTKLRLLQSYHFDSQSLLFTLLCGDNRLPERFKSADLLPDDISQMYNPILWGWVNYFRIGHSSECFGNVKDWVLEKVRRHLMHARKRRGFGWNR